MPTYEYACTTCGEHHEVVQSFHDDPLTTCPACGGPLRKVFGSIGVVFKGSGFYKTDSRPDGKKSEPAKAASTDTKSPSADSASPSSTPSSDSSTPTKKDGGSSGGSGTASPSSGSSSSSTSDKAAAS